MATASMPPLRAAIGSAIASAASHTTCSDEIRARRSERDQEVVDELADDRTSASTISHGNTEAAGSQVSP